MHLFACLSIFFIGLQYKLINIQNSIIMRKKLVSSFLVIFLSVTFTFAQQVIVSGKVTDNTGQGLPGVNIQDKGTGQGVATDFDGNYEISVAMGDVLVYSFVGFATEEVTVSKAVINVTMSEDAQSLDEVVVTALGVKREAKSLGYSLTEVDGDDLTQVKSTNAMNALQGRVAGVNVSTNSTGASGSTRVIIRGASSLTGDNQPLYVVDGIPIINSTKGSASTTQSTFDGGDDLGSINPDDIASVSVLKGSSAAALYGSLASNGVIMITTKSGKGQQGFGVEISSQLTFDKVNSDLYDFQTSYGQGLSGLRAGYRYDADGNIIDIEAEEGYEAAVEHAKDRGLDSWGAKFDGVPTIQWDGVKRPYSYSGDNIDKFYRVGSTAVNTVSLTKGAENYNYRFSFSNLDNADVFPNSSLNRNSFSFNSMAKINPKLTSTINAKYIIEKVHNRVGIGDGPGNANHIAMMLPSNLDIRDMKPGINEEGTELKFISSQWFTNPYWVVNKFNNDDKKNRLIASTTLRYDITDWLYASGRAGIDTYDLSRQNVTPAGTDYYPGGSIVNTKTTSALFDADVMLGVDKDITDHFTTKSFIGANTRKTSYERMGLIGKNFIIDDMESVMTTVSKTPSYAVGKTETNSLYGSFEFGFDELAYLTFTGRQEWYSTLSFPGKTTPNDDFYWSVSGSVLLNELFNESESLNFLKLRASYAQVAGGARSPYALNLNYRLYPDSHLGNIYASINGNTIPNPNLVPFQKDEFEVGLNGRFFDNRLYLDLAYYNNKTTNDIVAVGAASSSGYTQALLNIGELANQGVEFLLGGYPVRNDNFSWETSFNIGYNDSEIVHTDDTDSEINLNGGIGRAYLNTISHIVGEHYGVIKGTSYVRDDNGNIVYENVPTASNPDAIPRPVQGERKILGQGVAPLTAGWSNSFRYKNVSLNFLIDGKFGGQVYSETSIESYFKGRHKATLAGRENGLNVSGVDVDGNPFETTISPKNLQTYYRYISGENIGIAEEFVYDTDFIKFREISLTWGLPQKFLSGNFIEDLRLSIIGRNLFYIMKDVDSIDPEASLSNRNAQGIEMFGVPATRSLGFSVNVKF